MLSSCRNLKTRFLNPDQLFKVFNFLSNLLFSNSFFNTQTKQVVKQSKRQQLLDKDKVSQCFM